MNGGYIIQDRPCPACRNKRTVRLGLSNNLMCFNCRYRWTRGGTAPPQPAFFTAAEWTRLAAYRAAVQAGLYDDWPERDRVTY